MSDGEQQPAAVGQPRSRVFGRGLAVLGGWYLTAIAGAALYASSLPSHKSDGSCDGIGFGCTPNPRDGFKILMLFYGVPVLLASFVLSLVILGVLARLRVASASTWAPSRRTRWVRLALAVLFFGWLYGTALLFGLGLLNRASSWPEEVLAAAYARTTHYFVAGYVLAFAAPVLGLGIAALLRWRDWMKRFELAGS